MTKLQLFYILDKDPELTCSYYEQDTHFATINRVLYSYNDYNIIYMENNWFHCSKINCNLKDLNKSDVLEAISNAKKFVHNRIKMKKELKNQRELEEINKDFE